MDTSERYINMCRKATELQATWIPSGADWVYFIPLNPTLDSYGWEGKEGGWSGVIILAVTETDAGYYGPDTDTIDEYLKNKKVFWLPRIDQLIDMSHENWQHFVEKCAYNSEYWVPKDDHTTMEIQAIQRIMGRQYNKSWSGEDWI